MNVDILYVSFEINKKRLLFRLYTRYRIYVPIIDVRRENNMP